MLKIKGQATWVSAALYTALGIATIAIILAVGMPILENLKDKNTVSQTKELMLEFDDVIRETFEGPGSQREFFIDVKKGDFVIDGRKGKDGLNWSMNTKAKLMEPGVVLDEGNLKFKFKKNGDEYIITLSLDYKTIADLKIDGKDESKKLLGRYNALIRNDGEKGINIMFK